MSDEQSRQLSSLSEEEINGLTPAMRQYAQQKAQMPDAILLFRIGDFYETFYDDAKTVAKVLGLTLTARSKGDNPVPMAGVPHHALETYLARLVQAGLKVAISEQVEDPRQAKGIVRRQIVRIVTPGTLTDESLLKGREDNWLAAVCPAGGKKIGLAWVELASGRFLTQMLDEPAAIDELVRLRPAELLVGEDVAQRPAQGLPQAGEGADRAARSRGWRTGSSRRSRRERRLHEQFKVTTLAGLRLRGDGRVAAGGRGDPGLPAADAADATGAHHSDPSPQRRQVRADRPGDAALPGDRADDCGPRGGPARCWMRWTGRSTRWGRGCCGCGCATRCRQADEILARQQAVQQFLDHASVTKYVRQILANVGDVERIAARLGVERATPRDLANLAAALSQLPPLRELLEEIERRSGQPPGEEAEAAWSR